MLTKHVRFGDFSCISLSFSVRQRRENIEFEVLRKNTAHYAVFSIISSLCLSYRFNLLSFELRPSTLETPGSLPSNGGKSTLINYLVFTLSTNTTPVCLPTKHFINSLQVNSQFKIETVPISMNLYGYSGNTFLHVVLTRSR